MAFFRIKKIKGKEYAYMVESKWHKKGSRQKVKGYIGRAYRFDLKNNVDFLRHSKIEDVQNYIQSNGKNRIINDLVEWELFKFGISKEEFSIDLGNANIKKNKKNAALLINDGFMCSLTLKKLLDFKPEGDEQTDGYRLARAFVEAGIKVPQDIFVGLCQKLFSF
ncbi:hypothetical protein HYX04_02160 [Candidatus Woesearchaeota archaeon]|nr:hypothetical protein [Candidatus Woesearchaeota archaeon]